MKRIRFTYVVEWDADPEAYDGETDIRRMVEVEESNLECMDAVEYAGLITDAPSAYVYYNFSVIEEDAEPVW